MVSDKSRNNISWPVTVKSKDHGCTNQFFHWEHWQLRAKYI